MIFITDEIEVNAANIYNLYFYASWMPFHKKISIMIGKIEKKYKDINFLAVDVDYFKGLCKRYNVVSIPTITVMDNGNEIKRIEGLVMTSAFNSFYADIYKGKE